MSSSGAEGRVYEPSYRQQDVDETLDDHDRRINRLEKGALVALGYVTADAPDVARELIGLVPL